MSYKYSAIKLNNEHGALKYYVDDEHKPLSEISGLSGINIFVGENNSGKSRFMRELVKTEPIEFKRKDLNIEDLKIRLEALSKGINAIVDKHRNIVSFKIKQDIINIERGDLNIKPYYENFDYFSIIAVDKITKQKNLRDLDSLLDHFINGTFLLDMYKSHVDINIFSAQLKEYIFENKETLSSLKEYIFEAINFKKYYIPILRSLNCFDEYKKDEYKRSTDDIYKNRIIMKHQIHNSSEIFTGQLLYIKVKSMLLREPSERKKISDFQKYLAKEIFNVEEVSLIPREKKDVLYVKIGSEQERPIYDLGDGIQSLIIYTFPLFECENGLFFIEEPEIHLHPGMQRKFIEVISKLGKEKNHQYFFTTHSNHFLDLTLDFDDISVYTFKSTKDDKKIVKQVSFGDRSTLQLLGVQNSSVFLSNSTIWVEGITDRWYIRKFLELWQKEKRKGAEIIKEDVDYSFVEYGGSNITHWSFLDEEDNPVNVKRLCGTLFLITDKDGDSKIERKEKLKKALEDRYKMLECREIENILSLETIKKVIEKYEDESFVLPEFENYKKKDKYDYPHRDKLLGNFIEEIIFKGKEMKRVGGYKTASGTIKDKKSFCQKAIENMEYKDMSPLAINLAEQIYNFVNKIKTKIK